MMVAGKVIRDRALKDQAESGAIPVPLAAEARRYPRGSLFRRYAIYMAGLLSFALLASGGLGIYFAYQDTRALVDELQREKARSAATRIEQFIQGIERQLRGVLLVRRTGAAADYDAYHVELIKLLRLAPSVSDAAWLDAAGHERVRVSRLHRDLVGSDIDRSGDAAYTTARAGNAWYGRVEFRRQSEPHLTIAVPGNRVDDGVVYADVNLRFVHEVVSAIRIGTTGHAYVVDAQGRLISHPDASQVLRATSLAELPQVRAALEGPVGPALAQSTVIALGDDGRRALSAHATIAAPGWHVIVEQPISEAFAPLYGSLARAAILLLLGIALAIAASLALARRMTSPIRTLETGAQRIGEGHLEERVEVSTGDELQALADQFNRMAEKLRESYSGLEQRIEERTRQLEDANRDKARFLAAASHDLRQPVHALGLFVAQLEEVREEGERRRLIGKVAASSAAVSDLIEALLDISKLDAGAIETRTDSFALQPLFDRIEHAFAPAAQEKGLRMRVRPTPLRARTDSALLERILLNLCANAIRYTPHGGAIVTARRRGSSARVEVRDTGIGIAPEQQRRIFEEFYQVGGASGGEARGLGLGLAIVDRLARLLGLRVNVWSEPGRGSVFALDVPLASSQAPDHANAPVPSVAMRFDALPVLVVDDDPVAREATEGLLAQWGCRVLPAASGAEAMRLLHSDEERPRLIICDYRLGDGELGTAAIQAIRAHAASNIPAVIVTADSAGPLRETTEAAGVHLMHKPLNAARLRAFLTHVADTPAAPPRDARVNGVTG